MRLPGTAVRRNAFLLDVAPFDGMCAHVTGF
jgi:hypothetical protein